MISKIDISEFNDEVYEFDKFELVWTSDTHWYIIGDEGYFSINGVEDIKNINGKYILFNEDKDSIIFTDEEYQLIANIILNNK